MTPETKLLLERILGSHIEQCKGAIERREHGPLTYKIHEVPKMRERLEAYRKALQEIRE